jgi:hypothetical protein
MIPEIGPGSAHVPALVREAADNLGSRDDRYHEAPLELTRS